MTLSLFLSLTAIAGSLLSIAFSISAARNFARAKRIMKGDES